MKGIYIFLADGFEDVEALGTNDVLRRAGLRSTLVGIGEDPFAQSSHGVMVGVDDNLPYMDIDHAGTTEKDVLIFPGGMPGSKSLAECNIERIYRTITLACCYFYLAVHLYLCLGTAAGT